MVDKAAKPAFVLYLNGEEKQGKEAMGRELGTMLEENIPEFLVTLGEAVAESGKDFYTWNCSNPMALEKVASLYLSN